MKPTNILISAQGTAKLVDFGLAGITHGAATGDTDGDDQVDRSVDYAGLEKASNVKPGDVRSDIYFLGCVLYEMLTGRSPLLMTKDRHVRQQKERFLNAPAMTRDEVEAPAEVFELVGRMMSLDPQRRYQNPGQLLDAVRGARKAADAATPNSSAPAVVRSGKTTDTVTRPARPNASGRPVVCLVERHPQLQELLRDKLTETGYDVVLEEDPAAAAARFHNDPFAALLLDAAGIGPEAVVEFEEIMAAARKHPRGSAGILILSEKQAGWAERVTPDDRAVVMVRPVTLKQLHQKLVELVPLSPGEPAANQPD